MTQYFLKSGISQRQESIIFALCKKNRSILNIRRMVSVDHLRPTSLVRSGNRRPLADWKVGLHYFLKKKKYKNAFYSPRQTHRSSNELANDTFSLAMMSSCNWRQSVRKRNGESEKKLAFWEVSKGHSFARFPSLDKQVFSSQFSSLLLSTVST